MAVPTEVARAKTPEGEFLRAAGIDKHWVTSSGYVSCVSASGKWLGHGPSAKVVAAFEKLPEAERAPGAVKVPPLDDKDRVVPRPPEGGLVLRVHGRFLARDDKGGLRHATQKDFPANKSDLRYLLAPNTEYAWLTRDEWRSLVPEAKQGASAAVPRAIAERLARFQDRKSVV